MHSSFEPQISFLTQLILPTIYFSITSPFLSIIVTLLQLSSLQFNCSVVFDSLWPYGLQHARLPCPSPTPGVYSNLFPLSQWCHPTISSSVIPFSSCLQSFSASGSFPLSQFFTSGGQSIAASVSVLSMYVQDWFPLGLTDLILQSKGFSRVFSSTTVRKHQLFGAQPSLWSNSHLNMTIGKNSFDYMFLYW